MKADSVFIETLVRENPGFLPDPEHVRDGLDYVIANDFARYIIDLERYKETDKTRIALESLERLAITGGPMMRDLIQETLETLFENSSTNSEGFTTQLGHNLQVIRRDLLAHKR